MYNVVCEYNKCVGCNACLNVCANQAITVKDEIVSFNAYIDSAKCIHCERCKNVCPIRNDPKLIEPIEWKQGWTSYEDRIESSSGGAAQAIMKHFILTEGIVVACHFRGGRFIFSPFDNVNSIEECIGSKYVKSDTRLIYQQINNMLKEGKKVLFIGPPCQVFALKRIINNKLSDNLYTIDLICHGSPTQGLLEKALLDYGVNISEAFSIKFRDGNKFALQNDNKYIVPKGVHDRYTIAFLKGYIYTDGCYDCKFARRERISDITLGDSWGTDYKEEMEKGVSLVLVQTEKGKELIEGADLQLYDVNIDNAIKSNRQLSTPSIKPSFYNDLMKELKENNQFKKTIFKYAKRDCINQYIKLLLLKLHMWWIIEKRSDS